MSSSSSPATPASGSAPMDDATRRYWRANVSIMVVLLGVWAFVGLGCGVLWADWLNQWAIGGIPLGFWFAQQGSIATFVVLILVYAVAMNALDAKFHKETGGVAELPVHDPEDFEQADDEAGTDSKGGAA
ncbi:MAG: DUF4212 domain-containing protein [Planctomycetota bacterium]